MWQVKILHVIARHFVDTLQSEADSDSMLSVCSLACLPSLQKVHGIDFQQRLNIPPECASKVELWLLFERDVLVESDSAIVLCRIQHCPPTPPQQSSSKVERGEVELDVSAHRPSDIHTAATVSLSWSPDVSVFLRHVSRLWRC